MQRWLAGLALLAGAGISAGSGKPPVQEPSAQIEQSIREALLQGISPAALIAELRSRTPAGEAKRVATRHADLASVLRGLDPEVADADTWKRGLSELRGRIALARDQLQQDRREVDARAAGQTIRARQQSVLEQLGGELAALELAIEAVEHGADPAQVPALRKGLQQRLAEASPETPLRMLGIRTLPNRRLALAPRSLPQTLAQSASFAANDAAPATAEDRSAEPDLRDSTIVATAAELGHDYIAIHDFVRSQIRTEFHVGARRTPAQTLAARAGNDVEQASLLIALLRASGAGARYVQGVIELPVSRLAAITGLAQAPEIGRLLAAAGIAHEPVLDAGMVSAFRVEHVLVSAYVPYANFRGATHDLSGEAWVPLAPAIKMHATSGAGDLLAQAGIEAESFIREAVLASATQLPAGLLEQRINAHLGGQGGSAESLARRREVSADALGLLPSSLPGRWIGMVAESATPTDAMLQQVRIRLYQGSAEGAAVDREITMPLRDFANARLTLAFQPATEADHDIIERFGGIGQVPAYLVRLRPRLLRDGEPLLVGAQDLLPGDSLRVAVEFSSAAGQVEAEQAFIAGSYAAIALGGGTGSSPPVASTAVALSDGEFLAAELLANLARRYQQLRDQDERRIAGWAGVELLYPFPSASFVTTENRVERLFGMPQRLQFRGVSLDAVLHPLDVVVVGDMAAEDRFLQIAAAQASALEHHVFEQEWSVPTVSTLRGLAWALEAGIPLLQQTGGQLPAALQLPAELRTEINGQLALGRRVELPNAELTRGIWQGAVWRVFDPASGDSGYFIGGGYAGGTTVEAPEAWLLQFLAETLGSPYSPPPNPNPEAAHFIDVIGSTDGQIGVVDHLLDDPLAVRVTDRDFRPVQGARVQFVLTYGNGTLRGLDEGAPDTTTLETTTDRFGVARVRARLAPRILVAQQTFLESDDLFPEWLALNLVHAQLLSGQGLAGRIAGPIRFLGKPDAPVALAQRRRPTTSHPQGHPPGLEAGLWWVVPIDAHGNDIANVPISYSSSIVESDGTPLAPHFAVPGACMDALPNLDNCGQESLSRPSSGRTPDAVQVIAGSVSGENATRIIHRLHAQADGIPEVTTDLLVTRSDASYWVQTRFQTDRYGGVIDAATPMQQIGYRRPLAFYKERSGAAIVEPWEPGNNGPVLTRVQAGSIEPPLHEAGVGRYSTRYQGANQADYTPMWVGFKKDSGLDFEGEFKGFHSIELGIDSVEPAQIDLDPSGYPRQPVTVRYHWQRASAPSPQYPILPTLVIERDGERVSTWLAGENYPGTDDAGTAEITLPGIWAYDPAHRYTVQVVLHDGSPAAIASAKLPLNFGEQIIAGYDLVEPGTLSQRGAEGRFPANLELRSVADVAQAQICALPQVLAFTLFADADVVVRVRPLQPDGSPSLFERLLWPQGPATRGTHEIPLAWDDLPMGSYALEIDASVASTGQQEHLVARFHNYQERHDGAPLAHAMLKGVDLQNGNLGIQRVDVELGGRGPALALSRNYSSGSRAFSAFGRGWSSNLDARVLEEVCGQAWVIGADGGAQRFVRTGTYPMGITRYEPVAGYHGTLWKRNDQFDFYALDGTHYAFPRSHYGYRLTRVTDPSGNWLAYSYGAAPDLDAGKVREIAAKSGRWLRLSWRALRDDGVDQRRVVASAAGPDGLRIDYGYDDEGYLVSARRTGNGACAPGRCERYAYADNGSVFVADGIPDAERTQYQLGVALASITNEPDGSVRSFVYEPLSVFVRPQGGVGQATELPGVAVRTLTEADNAAWHFDYESALLGQTSSTTTVRDARNHTTTYELNAYGAAESVTDAAGSVHTTWDLQHYKPATRTDALGTLTAWTYDAHGNVLSERITHSAGTQEQTWTYAAPGEFAVPIKNRVATHVDARGYLQRFHHDAAGRPTRHEQGGKFRTWTYAGNGDLAGETDLNGGVSTHGYDAHGYRTSTTDPTLARTAATWDVCGRRVASEDALGHVTTYDYDAADRLIATHHPATAAGVAVDRVEYDDAARRRIETDPLNHATTTTLDPLGRTVGVRNAVGDTRTLVYDGNGNLVSETDFRGNATTYDYDAANRLQIKHEPLGRTTTYTHDALGHVLTESVAGPGSVTRKSTYAYAHPRYARTLVEQGSGTPEVARETYTLDAHGNAETTVDANGHTTTRTFDAFDRVLTESRGGVTATHTYDGNGNRLSTQQGEVTRSWTYDGANRVEMSTDGNGKVSKIRYYPTGAVKERQDARIRVVTEDIDARGRVTMRSGPRVDQVQSFGYDLAGNVTSETWANGRTLTHSYDELDRRKASVDALGAVGAWGYDGDGHLLSETDGGGHQTTFAVNALGHRTEARAPLGRTRTFVVGIHGELLSETSPLGKVTTHRYDSRGQRIGTTLPSDANAQALVWTYDGLGNVLTASDGNGQVTTHSYDARGRKERSTAPAVDDGGVAETFAYDDQDDLVTHTDRRGIAHAYDYDHEHRATRYQRAGVTQWTRTYDAVGNLETDTDANNHATTSTYDAANRRETSTRDGRTQRWTYTPTNQVKTHTDAAGAVTRYDYNLRDQLLTQTNGANETTTFTVDGDGLQTTRTLDGATWTNTFDAAHRLTGVASPEAHATSYGYNADDALTAITDGNLHVTTLDVDSQGRITRRTYPGAVVFSTTYDGNGNACSDTTPEHSTTRSFDALNRLRTETSGSITRTQSFDGNGNRLTASLGGDTVRTQTYDPHNRPLSDQLQTANSDDTLTATRDANGNRTQLRDARNVATTHTFDANNRLFTSTAPEGATSNTWNADGTLARISQANGVETVYDYDGAKRITSITHRKNGIATLTFRYIYDGRGNRTEERRTEAALPGQAARVQRSVHTYDRDDRLTASTVTYQPSNAQTPDTRTEWTLDDVGNRKTETVTELATNTVRANKTYTYNERDQLERITDPANDLQIDYAYDDNGNREQRIVRQNGVVTSQVDYSFDARDRLIQAQPNAPNEAIVQYQYDADDRRIARIETPRVNGIPQTPITTRSIYDGSNLLHEADPAQITATYRRSAVLDRHIDHATNTVRHYQLDALRTPVAMTDAAGNTVTATTFDAWGNPTQQTANGSSTIPWSIPNYANSGQAALLNADQQSIGFTGYQKDSATGLYYANARWYDPLVGSFNAMDPAWGAATKPVTFHKYLYANGNPTYFIDPTGKYGEAGHYYTTFIVARMLGYQSREAKTLALYSQLPDEIGTFDAIHQPIRATLRTVGYAMMPEWASSAVLQPEPARVYDTETVQDYFHALTGFDARVETRVSAETVASARTLEVAGLGIHRLADSFAHRRTDDPSKMYVEPLGHLFGGHAPDEISTRPELYGDYVETLARTLADRRGVKLPEEQIAKIREALESIGMEEATEGRETSNHALHAVVTGELSDEQLGQVLADSHEKTEEQVLSRVRELALTWVQESPGGSRSLLSPEKADAGLLDAQGQEAKNARDFLRRANLSGEAGLHPGRLTRDLSAAADEYLELSKRCRVGDCR
ncbi:MAG: hypothetical protein HYV17_14210 [Xanthomonadales bacterium]|nr:hypothetical protein [Xanthomonadales bacterium]